ncbi:hypothetical protein BJX66DRAFT_301406 [Aspergillus keveii]|uniref:Uncharacterized protein n=1 Tax=Aspergillus keveii TaxID=714993 RepID=A0ABR4GA97_9EURO
MSCDDRFTIRPGVRRILCPDRRAARGVACCPRAERLRIRWSRRAQDERNGKAKANRQGPRGLRPAGPSRTTHGISATCTRCRASLAAKAPGTPRQM